MWNKGDVAGTYVYGMGSCWRQVATSWRATRLPANLLHSSSRPVARSILPTPTPFMRTWESDPDHGSSHCVITCLPSSPFYIIYIKDVRLVIKKRNAIFRVI